MKKRRWEINAYEAKSDGTLVIYLEDAKGENEEIVVPRHDISRLMYGAIDALQGKPGTR